MKPNESVFRQLGSVNYLYDIGGIALQDSIDNCLFCFIHGYSPMLRRIKHLVE